jgi:hypothetical protein
MASAFDLYGQDSSPLPSPPANYRRGPDWHHGPPRCRQNQQLCEYDQKQPHDHACCCDPCRHDYINVCTGNGGPHGCCRCVPKAICLKFTPDTPGEICKVMTWKLRGEIVSSRGVAYTIALPGIGELTIFVGSPDAYNEYFGTETCIWQITAPDISIDQTTPIQHSGEVHCQAPPDWIIEGVDLPRGETTCTGTLSIEKFELAKIPFVTRWPDYVENPVEISCGYCSQFCEILCVRRGNASERTRIEFIWNETDLSWNANDDSGHSIELHEYGGECFLLLNFDTENEFNGQLLAIDPNACGIGMDLTANGEGTNFVSVSCNRCSCWKYICGTCRCVCKALCLVGVLDGVETRLELDWDAANSMWGDSEFGVTLGNDENDNCVVTVTGFDGSVLIRNDCGSQIVFNVSEDFEDMLAAGEVNYLYGFCRQCEGSCTQGSCLDLCEDVPDTIYCELTPTLWTPMLGCDDGDLCFDPITIPMFLVFVANEAAGEWRWIGYGIISCHSCNPPTAPVNYLVRVDYGCDGNGLFSIGQTSLGAGYNFTADPPCGADAVWDIEFETNYGMGGAGCCDVAAFHGNITR